MYLNCFQPKTGNFLMYGLRTSRLTPERFKTEKCVVKDIASLYKELWKHTQRLQYNC